MTDLFPTPAETASGLLVHASGSIRTTRDLVRSRTRALALRAGRTPPHVLQIDYEQAKRELTGESDPERQNAVLDAGLGLSREEGAQGSG